MKVRLKKWIRKTRAGRAVWQAAYLAKYEIRHLPQGLRALYAGRFHPSTHLLLRTTGTRNRQNWGDDLNIHFFEAATGKRVVPCPDSRFFCRTRLENYMCIGSTLTFGPLDATVVWGAGLINDAQGLALVSPPRKILAVRGPLTRQWLLRQGVACPEVYGDPALLLPRFYSPAPRPRARFGLIPHVHDLERAPDALRRLQAWPDLRLIALRGYGDWRNVIDDIAGCDLIASSSLHGLIAAEAYGIPSVWVEFSPPIPGWNFKFADFYASLGKTDLKPFRITTGTTPAELWERRVSWTPGRLDLDPLLAACPFDLRPIREAFPPSARRPAGAGTVSGAPPAPP